MKNLTWSALLAILAVFVPSLVAPAAGEPCWVCQYKPVAPAEKGTSEPKHAPTAPVKPKGFEWLQNDGPSPLFDLPCGPDRQLIFNCDRIQT